MPQAPCACSSTFPVCDFRSQMYHMVQNGRQSSSLCTHIPGSRMEEELNEDTLSPSKKVFQKYHPMLLLIAQWPKCCHIPLLAAKKLRNVVLINRCCLEHCSAKDPKALPCLCGKENTAQLMMPSFIVGVEPTACIAVFVLLVYCQKVLSPGIPKVFGAVPANRARHMASTLPSPTTEQNSRRGFLVLCRLILFRSVASLRCPLPISKPGVCRAVCVVTAWTSKRRKKYVTKVAAASSPNERVF